MSDTISIQIRLSNEERDKLYKFHQNAQELGENISLNKIVNSALQEYLSLKHWPLFQEILTPNLGKGNPYCFQSRLEPDTYNLLFEAKKEAKTTMNAVARAAVLYYTGGNVDGDKISVSVKDKLDRIVAIDKAVKQLEAEKDKIKQSLAPLAVTSNQTTLPPKSKPRYKC